VVSTLRFEAGIAFSTGLQLLRSFYEFDLAVDDEATTGRRSSLLESVMERRAVCGIGSTQLRLS